MSRITRPVFISVLLTVSAVAVGCNVDPYHLGGDGGLPGDSDAASIDARGGDGGGGAAAAHDAGPMNDACIPLPEVCNGVDDDCDGMVDENFNLQMDPANCGACGNACSLPNMAGTCASAMCEYECLAGWVDLDNDIETNGCEYPCVPTNGGVEACDFTDNDCDGAIDEDFNLDDDVNNCGGCGKPCIVLNADPVCDQGMCGYGTCDDGFSDVVAGVPGCDYQCPVWPPTSETCNGIDEDCDGTIDELPIAGLGDDCTSAGNEQLGDTGECTFGQVTCSFGTEQCTGYVGPKSESCNDLDDDCDGQIDETFDKLNDPRYCGGCTACSIPNAVPACNNGVCEILTCKPGFHDLDGDVGNGCEYACVKSGPEICDGKDNDCDGLIDDADPDLQQPNNFCATLGTCAGTTPVCGPSACDSTPHWHCEYPGAAETDACGDLLLEETLCDSADGDCDGLTDEAFPEVTPQPMACTDSGVGICQGTGTYECNTAGDGVTCNITSPGQTATAEVCNNLDDDCDGVIDNGVVDDMVQVTGSTTYWIYTYEASRPNATSSSGGTAEHRPCSKEGVVPWRNVTWLEAEAACQAAGKRLCTEAEWQLACAGALGNTYPYGNAYQPTWCNGNDYDHDCTAPNDDIVLPTGTAFGCPAPAESLCISDFSAFDLSGNLKEWTASQVGSSPVTYRIRGGAYDNIDKGLTCQFDFISAEADFYFPNLGFRCCSDTAP
jgi:hypothetical protein